MLHGVTRKPEIAIVGAGNVGSALAVSLAQAGYRVKEIVVRDGSRSLRKARELASAVRAQMRQVSKARLEVSVVWFCVPDGEIAAAARSVATRSWKGRVAFHSSGALTGDELEALSKRGASVASVHPLMTFVRGSRPGLKGVPFAVEGDRKAVATARKILKDLHAPVFSIRKLDKAAYHAWGMFASPLLIALLATTERVAMLAGVDAKSARKRMLPIVQQTIANYAMLGPAGAFSGPIVRGDAETVKKHLAVLRRNEVARGAYAGLARSALKYLPVKNRGVLERLLKRRAEKVSTK